jgi:hypothetical protein
LETLLPLGKVDPGLRAPEIGLDLGAVAGDAKLLEELGYDGVVMRRPKQDPYVVMAFRLKPRRASKSAQPSPWFPRSPTITALSA